MPHAIIPIFIPELACPNQCIFCNQTKISGQLLVPDKTEIINKIDSYLKTIPPTTFTEVAFFGGNFTGIHIEQQIEYLSIANTYFTKNQISGIRISTRPDYITPTILDVLKQYNVSTIEIGAQSCDDEVLILSKRGYTYDTIIKAALLIKQLGFKLGIQMMTGLPGDTTEKTIATAKQIIEMHADNTRIYPLLIIKDTELAFQFENNTYSPLSLQDAINRVKHIVPMFESANIYIQKIGLHPSDELLNGTGIVAGPFHQNFRELIYTSIWKDLLLPFTNSNNNTYITIESSPKEVNYAAGFNGSNKKMLETHFKSVSFKKNDTLTKRNFNVLYS